VPRVKVPPALTLTLPPTRVIVLEFTGLKASVPALMPKLPLIVAAPAVVVNVPPSR